MATLEEITPLSRLQTLPLEILEPIHIQSENLALIYVCRRFHTALSVNAVCLHFCTNVFYHGNPKRVGPDRSNMIRLQIAILSSKWFTLEFSVQVENAVKKVQEHAYQQNKAAAKAFNDTCSNEWRSPGANKVLCTFGTYLPRHSLYGPWTDYKVNFLRRLVQWNAKVAWQDLDAAERGIQEAILGG